jgi:threonine dehydrogenase-like Zn-dependent dehydrogenase
MRAGVFHEVGRIAAADVDEPELGPGDALVQVAACGVCGSDLESWRHGSNVTPGQVMGHEIGGRVLDADPASGLTPGMVVAVRPLLACGDCPQCLAGRAQLCERSLVQGLGYGLPGGFAERVRVPRAKAGGNVIVLPDGLDPALAALVEPLAVSLRGAKHAGIGPGDVVLVTGLGQIGLGAVALAKALGAGTVVAVDPSARRREVATAVGATHVVDPLTDKADLVVREITGPGPYGLGAAADAAIECSGVPASFTTAVKSLRPQGRLSLVAHSVEPFAAKSGRIVEKELTVQGSFGYDGEMKEVADLIADGRLDPGVFVSHRISLDQIDQAFVQQADAANSVKVLVQP